VAGKKVELEILRNNNESFLRIFRNSTLTDKRGTPKQENKISGRPMGGGDLSQGVRVEQTRRRMEIEAAPSITAKTLQKALIPVGRQISIGIAPD
jgi:hypothetical protein